MENLNATLANNLTAIFAVMGIVIALLLGFVVKLERDLNKMYKRYRKMTAGADDVNVQQILIEYSEQISQAIEENNKIRSDIEKISSAAMRAITRVAVVRFNAFHDDTAELSYCIALLDEENTGVIISSLNGREFTRSYVKPVVKGKAQQYKLTKEEEQAIHDAGIPPEERQQE